MKIFYTEADAGSVRVGNETFTALIPNGYGDGETKLTILDKSEEVPEGAKFFTAIEGKAFLVYFYDCSGAGELSEKTVDTLSGRYGCYTGDGMQNYGSVYLKKWED